MSYSIIKTAEYMEWFSGLPNKSQKLVEKRILNIEQENHFGDVKRIDAIAELRFKSGMRIYFGKLNEKAIVLLLGGNKNGQDKDITQAKRLFVRRYADHKT